MERGKEIPTLDYATGEKKSWGIVLWIIAAIVFLVAVYRVLFPPLRSSYSAPRVQSASNLRQIGQAILLYTNENHGNYPDSFQTLLTSEDITSDVFVSPDREETAANGPTTQATLDQLVAGGHLSYVYLGSGLTSKTVANGDVVAYEIPWSSQSGANVLYGDGHVDFVNAAMAGQIAARAANGVRPVTRP